MNIKKEILELCDEMINFWDGLQREIEQIPNENQDDVVLKWKSYFPEHSDVVSKLSWTKMHVDNLQDELIMRGVLKYED
jgi:hypothetical protein